MPIILLISILFCIGWCIWRVIITRKQYFQQLKNQPVVLFILIYTIIFTVISQMSAIQIGLRHIMPIVIMITFLTSISLDSFYSFISSLYQNYLKYVFAIASVCLVIIVVKTFPFYLSYYNVLAGGTNNGYVIATDSNYDWGQDVKRLGAWTKNNHVQKLYTDIFSSAPLSYYLNFEPNYINPIDSNIPPTGSYLAVSTFRYTNNIFDHAVPNNKKYSAWPIKLVGKAGPSIFIFQIK